MLWCYTSSGEDSALVHCSGEDSALVHCSGEDSALVHCSGEDSAPVHCRREDRVLWCTSSGVDSAPLQMEWKVDTPMFFELEELVEGTVLCYSTCSRDWSSICSSVNFIGVPSCPLSKLSQFLLLQCQSHWSPFCSKCHRVQCSATPDIAETGVLSPLVSILLELLLLQSQFYHSSFSFPISVLFESLLLQVS